MQLGSVACGSFHCPGFLGSSFPVVLRGRVSDFSVLFLSSRQPSGLNPHSACCLISGIFPEILDLNIYNSEIGVLYGSGVRKVG